MEAPVGEEGAAGIGPGAPCPVWWEEGGAAGREVGGGKHAGREVGGAARAGGGSRIAILEPLLRPVLPQAVAEAVAAATGRERGGRRAGPERRAPAGSPGGSARYRPAVARVGGEMEAGAGREAGRRVGDAGERRGER
nr:uncharacterized protein LOC127315820 [Lolium perenne]